MEKKSQKKDKDTVFFFEGQVKDIRQQLNEQLKCLDVRLETQVSLVSEIQDYFRRRAEVELEYSRSLEKLSKGLLLRHKAEKQKREQWHLFSSYSCWQHLVATTRRQSRDHAVLSEIYANQLISRFNHIMEDVQRIYKRCREIGIEGHEELLKVLHELHTSMKTYHTYHAEERQAEGKLRAIESQRAKLEQSIPKEKLERSKKFKLIVKEIEKRQSKYNDAKIKALKARNDYLLCMDASNAAIHKYFVDDLSDLVDCMDFGFHTCLARTLMMHLSSEDSLRKSQQSHIDGMNKCITSLDSRVDKQKFLEFNNSAFMVPKKFEFQSHKADEIVEISVEKNIKEDLEQRQKQLAKRLTALKTESEEIWKTLETAERSLLEMITAKDYDVSSLFEEENNRCILKQPEAVAIKLRADRQETEDFYLNKFREYTLGSNLIARLQAKQSVMGRALGSEEEDSLSQTSSVGSSPHPATRPHSLPQKIRKKRIGRTPMVGQPKLFGGSLEEYLESTGQEIPLLIQSCIRIINLYGLHHQGIFRVSGSQVEINNFKEAFERGDDPLADMTDASDINSVGGVLKLYLRELREPLFPIYYFELLMEVSQLDSKHEFISRVRDLVVNLPRPVVIVLRYLFAFLNHLSEFSDENMMDPYNLAICFGPTLLPIPEDKDQVQYQNLVNELIKNLIIYQEEIFPNDGGIIYEKYISTNVPDENDVGESPPDQGPDQVDDSEADNVPSEDDAVFPEPDIALNLFGKAEILEAVAQFDFKARSDRELSFHKGDTLTLYTQVSNDWWRGNFNGRDGLIPDKYILLKIRDEDKDKISTDSGGCGGERRRTSSSSDSLSGISPSPRIHSSSDFIMEESCSSRDGDVSLLDVSTNSVPCSQLGSPRNSDPRGRRRSLSPSSLNGLKPLVSPGWDVRKLRPCLSADESGDVRDKGDSEKRQKETKNIHDDSGTECADHISSTGTSLSDLNLRDLSAYDPADEHSNQELAKDLNSTLAKVYTSINTLEKEKELERQLQRRRELLEEHDETILETKSVKKTLRPCKDTPDLVMDLPVNPSSPTSSTSSGGGGLGESPPKDTGSSRDDKIIDAPVGVVKKLTRTASQTSESGIGGSLSELTTAERFALSNQCTMKKGTMSRSQTVGINSSSPLMVSGQSLTDAQTQTFPTVRRSASTNVDMSPQNAPHETDNSQPVLPEQKRHSIGKNPPDIPDKPDKTKTTMNSTSSLLTKVDVGEQMRKDTLVGSHLSTKPQVKVKPPVMKKPTNYIPSPEVQRRTQEREYKQTSC